MSHDQKQLLALYQRHFGESAQTIAELPLHGSSRKRFRLSRGSHSVIGVVNSDAQENQCFRRLSEHFRRYQLPVPEVYVYTNDRYLEQDLGNDTLFSRLKSYQKCLAGAPDEQQLYDYYQWALGYLVQFQVVAGKTINTDVIKPDHCFGYQSMFDDCLSFKREFLQRLMIEFEHDSLMADFHTLASHLSQAEHSFFLYRDFQSRNIMVTEDGLYFIDFQSGMYGALAYDVVSLLYQSQAQLSEVVREQLLDHYLSELVKVIDYSIPLFKAQYQGFIFLRLIQVLGAYGKLGLGLNRPYFKQGIPFAVEAVENALKYHGLPLILPELDKVFERLKTVKTMV